jgi:hypothetical protein
MTNVASHDQMRSTMTQYNCDDNSRLTSGKKEAVTINKLRKQKRLMNDTLVNLHLKFYAENPSNAVTQHSRSFDHSLFAVPRKKIDKRFFVRDMTTFN